MKAVLLNSADKIEDTGNGNLLGMTRTVVHDCDEMGQNCASWLTSSALTDSTMPLDLRLGAGHLNADRAVRQFRNGEFDSDGAAVPVLGWDYGQTNGDDDINKYAISQPLKAGSYISLTLAWDREVVFQNDADMDGAYDDGDTFVSDCCLNDLDLYLMPAGSTSLAQRTTLSNSAVMSLEHIFFQIPTTQQYEIWVQQFSSPFGLPQDYALAWWSVPNMAGTGMGDYDGSGVVDIGDYQLWRANFGSTTNLAADGNGNGTVDAADYVLWRKNFTSGSGSLAAVPEPGGLMLLALAGMLLGCRRKGAISCAE